MSEKEIKEIAKEEFMNNVMTNLDSTLIFTYIKTLEEENKMYAELKDDYENRIDEVVDILTSLLLYDTSKRSDTGLILVNANKLIEILKGDDNNERYFTNV